MLDILKKSLQDFSAGRWDDLKASCTDDVIYEEVATQVRVEGAEKFLDVLRGWRRAFPDLEATVLGGFEMGDDVVAEVEWEGTHTGPLEGPFGTIQATDKKGRTKAVIVMKLKDGKIVEERHYFDLLTVLSQIGAIPGLGTRPQPSAKPGVEATPVH